MVGRGWGCPEQGWLAGRTLTGFKVKGKGDHTWDQACTRRRGLVEGRGRGLRLPDHGTDLRQDKPLRVC